MKTRILKLIVPLAFVSFLSFISCQKVPTPIKPTPTPSGEQPKPTPPPVDSEVEQKYIETFEPEAKAKMKYTYTHIFKDASGKTIESKDYTTEILEALEDSIRIRTSISPSGEIPREYLLKRPSIVLIDYVKPDKPTIKFKVIANETVKVGAGEFKNAMKVQAIDDKKTKFTNWLVTGVGVVKSAREASPVPATGNLFYELKVK